ncbi:MAG TPA: hypothetical protein VKY74_13790 [Chloroflexia bacterium]|nr:hypothetical protein [Chloroflexia bacterium]
MGRPYSAIEKTTLTSVTVTPDGTTPPGAHPRREPGLDLTARQAIAYFQELASIGTDHAIVNTPIAHLPGALDIWAAEVIPAVAQIVPLGR